MTSFMQPKIQTLCYCWVVTRKDGTKLGFTDHDEPITINDIKCQPETGMVTGSSEIESGFAINGGQVEAALNADAISTEDILAGLYDRATIQHYLVNWQAPENIELLRTMTIAKVTKSNGQFTAEMDGLLSGFDAPQGRYFRRQCDAELGDQNCGVDLNNMAHQTSSTIVQDAEGHTVTIEVLDQAEAAFQNGTLTIDDLSYKIANIRANDAHWVIQLREPLKTALTKNMPCRLTKGCDKSFATCKSQFDNGLNFRGFPHLPGSDAAYQFAKREDIFDGEAIVP